MQQCVNFKDPGVQVYGGTLFGQLQDEADALFCKLPPPKPSNPIRNGATRVANMRSYHNRSNGCVHADTSVTMADGTKKRAATISQGDVVFTPAGPAKVLCVVASRCENNRMELVTLPGGLRITSYHPVRIGGKWSFPVTLNHNEVDTPVDLVYNFVLDAHHVMVMDGVECITLGHSFSGPVVGHSYFGSSAVVEDLKQMAGWRSGRVTFAPGSLKRSPLTAKVVGYDQAKEIIA